MVAGLPLVCGVPKAQAETVSFTSSFTDEGPNNNGVNFVGNFSIGTNPSGTYTEAFVAPGTTDTITDFLAVKDTDYFGGTDSLAVSFNFSVPSGSGTIDGTGSAIFFIVDGGQVSFPTTPTAISLGDGSVVDVSLSSGDFTDFFSNNTAHIDATLTWEGSSVAATPLPAALPLFAGGLGFFGMIARRRRRKAQNTLAVA